MPMEVMNLRSDTQTLPTPEMLQAIMTATLGDDTYDEDPTVQRLESMAAERLGMEAAALVISGTMGNLVCLMTHARPGDEIILDFESHIFWSEAGSLANLAGLMPMPARSRNGLLDPTELKASIRRRDLHQPIPRLFCLENTHNRSGGRVVPLDLHRELCSTAHEHGLAVHLDGARIFNASVATGIPVSDYTENVDSVMFSLSKGLSCPLGSVVCGTKQFIAEAKRHRKRLGGGMRQAGIIAACGIIALEQMIDRLADDHKNTYLLAQRLADVPGLRVDLEGVETNMVNVDHTPSSLGTEEVLSLWRAVGVLATGRPPTHIRLVLHRTYGPDAVEETARRIRTAMERN